MITILKKQWVSLALITLIIGLYLLFRLPNLTILPIFADEAIYIRWAQIMKSEPTLRFVSVSDGKTPLFMWLMIPFFKLFVDPLYAGRFLSVLAGLGTLTGILFLGWRFFSKWVGLFAAFVIAICPMFVFFDRMALVDSMLAAGSIWSLNLALLLVQKPRLDLAMFLGGVLGSAMLVKTPGYFSILTLPFTLAIFNWSAKKPVARLIKLGCLWLVASLIAFGIYNILRLGPGFDNLSSRNQDYVHPLARLWEMPFDPLMPHLRDLFNWYPLILSWPILIGLVGALVQIIGSLFFWLRKFVLKKNAPAFFHLNPYTLTILGWALIPLLAETSLLKTFTARYILFSTVALVFLSSWFLVFGGQLLKFKLWTWSLVILIFLGFTGYTNYLLLTNPAIAPLPREARRGYLEDWTAGYGLKEIANFLAEKAEKELVVVGTEGSFGTLPDGLWIYLDKTPNIVVIGGGADISDQVRGSAKEHPTYFVANKSRVSSPPPNVRLIKEYPKAVGPELPQDAILLFEVLPNN